MRMRASSPAALSPRSTRLALQCQQQLARPAVIAVLAQVDALPGPQGEATVADREGERWPEEGGLDVRGHVVGALERVGEGGRAVGDGLAEPGLEVAADVRRGVLVQGQRGRGVADEDVQEPDRDLAELRQGPDDLPGGEGGAAGPRPRAELG